MPKQHVLLTSNNLLTLASTETRSWKTKDAQIKKHDKLCNPGLWPLEHCFLAGINHFHFALSNKLCAFARCYKINLYLGSKACTFAAYELTAQLSDLEDHLK